MRHRRHLPQLDGGVFLTDAGLETELVFHDGRELPAFAAFPLLGEPAGRERLRRYYAGYVALARERGLGLVLESPTWRASPRWARELGLSDPELAALNRDAIALMVEVRETYRDGPPVVVSGCVGPSADAYAPAAILTAQEAQAYHGTQVATFADTEVDLVTAMTLAYVEEGVGIARAAREAGLPVVLSFTVETDGDLPSGQPLAEAIAQVDAETDATPAYYMVNCAHPTHIAGPLKAGHPALRRIGGLRVNASVRSHAELDEATELEVGDPADLGARCAGLAEHLPGVTVLGGCCGTDHRHVRAIRDAWLARPGA